MQPVNLPIPVKPFTYPNKSFMKSSEPKTKEGKSSARRLAVETLLTIDASRAPFDEVLQSLRAKPDIHRQVVGYVRGITRWKRWLDFLIATFYRGDAGSLENSVVQVLRLGLYELYKTERPHHAVIHEAVQLAKNMIRTGAGGLVNGILRSAQRQWHNPPKPPSEPLVTFLGITHSHPDWLVQRWIDRFGKDEAIKLLKWNNNTPSFSLRLRYRTISGLRSQFDAKEISIEQGKFIEEYVKTNRLQPLLKKGLIQEGFAVVHDESAGLVVKLLAPQAGELIVDACAAPGGKTLHIHDLMRGEGQILAIDAQKKRINMLSKLKEELKLEAVEVLCADIRDLVQAKQPVQADRVLLDVPCTGLGVLAKRADLRWHRTPDELEKVTVLQRELLLAAAKMVRPGGVLLYSTCSIAPEENEEQVTWFLERNAGFSLEKPPATYPAEVISPEGYLCTLPHVHGVDGAFGAILRKAEDPE